MLKVIVARFKLVEFTQVHILVRNHDRPESHGREVALDHLVQDLSFFLFSHFLSGELAHHILSAYVKKKFGCSLNENSDILITLLLDSNQRLLSLTIEWNIAYNALFLICQNVLNNWRQVIFQKESDYSLLRSIPDDYW